MVPVESPHRTFNSTSYICIRSQIFSVAKQQQKSKVQKKDIKPKNDIATNGFLPTSKANCLEGIKKKISTDVEMCSHTMMMMMTNLMWGKLCMNESWKESQNSVLKADKYTRCNL